MTIPTEFSHVDTSDAGSSISGSGMIEPLCLKCSSPIAMNAELIKSLSEQTTRHVFTRRGSTKSLHCIQCRICESELKKEWAREHVIEHFANKEIFYCTDCQKHMNEISIERLPEPRYRQSFLTQIAESGRLIAVTKDELHGGSTPDSSVQPRCGKCYKIFDYIRPLLHKLFESNVKIYETEEGMVCADTCFICCLCEKAENCISGIQFHVLDHVKFGDVLCRGCKSKQQSSAEELICYACNLEISAGTEFLICANDDRHSYHLDCAEVSTANYKKMSKTQKSSWRCVICKARKGKASRSNSPTKLKERPSLEVKHPSSDNPRDPERRKKKH